MGGKLISEKQKKMLGELLSDVVKNKESPHELDLGKAAVILYEVNKIGYSLTAMDVAEIIEISGDHYSKSAIELLKSMANAYVSLVFGMKQWGPITT